MWFVSPEFDAEVFQSLAQASGGATMVERGGVWISAYAGRPIVVSDKMPSSGTDGEVMALFGNMQQAVAFGARRDFQALVDPSRYLEYDQIAVRSTERFDLVCHGLGDASTAGPLIGLVANS